MKIGPRARTIALALLAPVDGAWLGAFRIGYGLCLFASVSWILVQSLWPAPGQTPWVDYHFLSSAFHFKYWGFAWVQIPAREGLYALLYALLGLSVCVAAGFCFRLSAWLLALGFCWFSLLEAALYANHYYLMCLLGLLLAASPAARTLSIDAWWRARRGGSIRGDVPVIWLYLFRLQIGVVYFGASLAKAHGDWLVHAQPLRIWFSSQTGLPLIGPLFLEPWVAPLASWLGFLFDACIAFLLLVPRWRLAAYGGVVIFHVATYVLFPRIVMFPVIMVTSALVFFSPSWPRELAARMGRRRVGLPAREAPRATPRLGWTQRSGLALALVYALWQVALPLRFLAYGGDVRWHEQGLRFSWRVLHREKLGTVDFRVLSKRTGQRWQLSPELYLNQFQAVELAEQPDLIVQLAHHIRDDFARRGAGLVEVHADAVATLNGRRPARLVDPDVDLAALEPGLARAAWIRPAPTDPPPQIRATR